MRDKKSKRPPAKPMVKQGTLPVLQRRPSKEAVKRKRSSPTPSAWKYLDPALRLRLADLDSKRFEDFFLHFLNSGVELTVARKGNAITRRVIRAETYAAGSGKNQKGIDLRILVAGDEVWCIQCKRHKKWTRAQTKSAIKKAANRLGFDTFSAR